MRTVLELAKAFEEETRKQAEAIDLAVQNVMNKRVENLKAHLNTELASIEKCISQERANLVKKAVMLWRLPIWILGGLSCLLMGLNAFLIWEAKGYYEKMNEWAESAENYKATSQQIKLEKCSVAKGKNQYCVKIDSKQKGKYWGDEADLVVLPIPVEK